MVDERYISRSIQFNDVMSLDVAAQQLRTKKVLKKNNTEIHKTRNDRNA